MQPKHTDKMLASVDADVLGGGAADTHFKLRAEAAMTAAKRAVWEASVAHVANGMVSSHMPMGYAPPLQVQRSREAAAQSVLNSLDSIADDLLALSRQFQALAAAKAVQATPALLSTATDMPAVVDDALVVATVSSGEPAVSEKRVVRRGRSRSLNKLSEFKPSSRSTSPRLSGSRLSERRLFRLGSIVSLSTTGSEGDKNPNGLAVPSPPKSPTNERSDHSWDEGDGAWRCCLEDSDANLSDGVDHRTAVSDEANNKTNMN
eukprot:gnl/TRDRNA2_/TRDRNA2_89779_c0_seq1.p1 gnl/TRDRNA2_/TRDRNA2_89779_c0~~gnl/TRDRNA2_/TRDRNA2_89779_c0_seq1.p1  ORF type:complete len:262 (-),score=39.93 gnl/TRDRNA2_/TRDRNA2_89779_c0_seq1:87-872(-)